MKLSSIFSDGMVLQRNKEVTISGWTNPNREVSLVFVEKKYTTTSSDKDGKWSIHLEKLEAGGPYQMEIEADEKIVIHDILIGDVWVLGGQSNMELPVSRTLDLLYEEVKAVHQPSIRQFSVPQHYYFDQPKQALDGGEWRKATSPQVMNFSAVGYFFANKIYEQYGVPIGLIMTAVGGTPIEAWMSETLLREIGGYDDELHLCKNEGYIEETKRNDEKRQQLWFKSLDENDAGLIEKWYHPSQSIEDWSDFDVPNSWKETPLEAIRGSVWFQKEVDVPETLLQGEVKLSLGTIVDADHTYVNGIRIGTTGYRYPPRRYPVPKGVLKPGKNRISVRVISTQSTGEFIKDMPYKLTANGEELDLQGPWKYKIGAITEELAPATFFQYKPAGLYNGMIAPIEKYTMKGVLWYQGESNAGQPQNYSYMMHRLISQWRDHWQLGDFPFIYTQLANYETGAGNKQNSNWAILREEQRLALENPNTAMAVTIDIGEYNDLHPQDKKTLGERLALSARKLAYEEELVYSGPIYKQMKRIGTSIQLFFDHVGSGLVARNASDGKLHLFTICGADGQYVPATATIQEDSVIVSSELIKEPMHVRYAWSDNPEGANLFNREGLPASPFTTESME